HSDAACSRAHAIVAIDPAGDRIAAEIDDMSAMHSNLIDQWLEDAIKAASQFLRAALRTKFLRQRVRQRREA
ncbi:MAG TPA: hypothetical protein VJX31_04075, partial [Casimicrobiaceae bacterium]|nr:hypothetical protein [Casimicrobiaceae bacterium]